jgi:hypothetical protein
MSLTSELGFHQVEQIADLLDETELLLREAHVKLALDPHHQSDQVDRIKAKGFPEVLIVLRQRVRFTHFLFEQGHKLGAKRFPVWHLERPSLTAFPEGFIPPNSDRIPTGIAVEPGEMLVWCLDGHIGCNGSCGAYLTRLRDQPQ